MKLENENILSLKENIIYTSFEESGVIFNLDDRRLHELNRTSIIILDLLDERKDVRELIRKFSLKCGKSEDSIEKDVIGFLENLVERGWVYVQ